MKIIKISRCNECNFFKFKAVTVDKMSRFECYNPEAQRKNGNYRIVNRNNAYSGKPPLWCPLDDYEEIK